MATNITGTLNFIVNLDDTTPITPGCHLDDERKITESFNQVVTLGS